MSVSPTKESIRTPSLAALNALPLNAPPSPRAHRVLRRLQSAQTLRSEDARNNMQPSLISQQRQQQQQNQNVQRTLSTAQKDSSRLANPALQSRGRSNSDAAVLSIPGSSTGKRQTTTRKSIPMDVLSLDRLIRDGPTDGDLVTGLDSMRLKILDQGIKSDSDGMVSHSTADDICHINSSSRLFASTYGSYY